MFGKKTFEAVILDEMAVSRGQPVKNCISSRKEQTMSGCVLPSMCHLNAVEVLTFKFFYYPGLQSSVKQFERLYAHKKYEKNYEIVKLSSG